MPTLEIRGAPLHFHDAGQGLPVLLLHAFPLTSEMLLPQLQALQGQCRVLLPDLRGFGQSPLPERAGPTRMEDLAQDALALLDALDIDQAVVGGVSMGGYASMALLRQDPGRVKGLVLIDTQQGADDEAGKQKREETARAVETRGIEVLAESMPPKLISPKASPEVRSQVERLIRANRPAGAAAALRGMALRTASKDILARFGGPALVVVGEEDVLTPVEKARELAGLISGATLVTVPGAGHLAPLEAPAAVNAALQTFLRGIS